MRIISKFHDYYDSIQSVGYDPELVYHRVQHEGIIPSVEGEYYSNVDRKFNMPFDLPHFTQSFLDTMDKRNTWGWNFLPHDAYLWLIGFCGRYYMVLDTGVEYTGVNYNHEFFYDEDSAVEYYKNKLETDKISFRGFDLIGECKINPFSDLVEPFRVLNAPMFAIKMVDRYSLFKSKKVIVNPILKEFKFYRLFDTFSAYQEIAMFLSGVLGWPENATVDISDTDMRDSKGFDEWSFKNLPSNKK